MNDAEKKKQLRRYKAFATGLFILMAICFVATTLLQRTHSSHWLGYIRAFSEAAMVGALADWFAVTALFHYPLGIKIPHTNLIQNKKEQIGDNLGNFVVENFLSPQNIRPYMLKLKISGVAGDWLASASNQEKLIDELSAIVLDIIHRLQDEEVIQFIASKAKEMASEVKINQVVGNGLEYLLERNDHQRLVTSLSAEIKSYIVNNREIVRDRVKKESFTLIPKFVDDAIADKITSGLSSFFDEVEQDATHAVRQEVTQKLWNFAQELKNEEKWEVEFRSIRDNFLQEGKLEQYAGDIWRSVKKSLEKELLSKSSALKTYLRTNLQELSVKLNTDPEFQNKINGWLRVTAYKYILKNTHHFGSLISATVGNWEGQELSNKLELEVGKDLQFIRLNGTLVGGLVGLVIYTLANFLL